MWFKWEKPEDPTKAAVPPNNYGDIPSTNNKNIKGPKRTEGAAGTTGMDEGTQLSILLPTPHLDTKFLLVLAMEMMREKEALRGNQVEK